MLKKIISIVILLSSHTYATTVGSDSAVTAISNQVILLDGDIVAGFAYLQGGLAVLDNTSTATWNSSFPVTSSIDLRGGGLYLSTDLYITETGSAFSSLGTIIANNCAIDFSATITSVYSGISLASTLICPLVFLTQTNIPPLGAGLFVANVPFVRWKHDGTQVSGAGIFPFGQSTVFNFNGTSLSSAFGFLAASPGAHSWSPTTTLLASNNNATNIQIMDTVSLARRTQGNSPAANDMAFHPSSYYLGAVGNTYVKAFQVSPIAFTLGASFGVTGLTNAVTACDWVPSGTYFATGANAATGNIAMYALGGTAAAPTLTAVGGATATAGATVATLRCHPVFNNIFAVGLQTSGENVQVYNFNAGSSTVTKVVGATTANSQVIAVDWSPSGSCLAVSGQDSDILIYTYNNTAGTLTPQVDYQISGTGGLRYSSTGYLVQGLAAPGTSFAETATLRVYAPTTAQPFTNKGYFDNAYVVLHNDLLIDDCELHFVGNCTIAGNGNTVDLNGTATLVIEQYANLTLDNLTLIGVSDGNIRMVGNASQLTLDDVTMVLDNNFSFTQGGLTIVDDVILAGENVQFNYTSATISYIQPNSSLILDNSLTFSYDPRVAVNNLLQFSDATAFLVLDGATLAATVTGLSLTSGTLLVNGHSYITSSAVNASQGVILGSGTSTCYNMPVQVMPAAVLEVTSGYLVNKNL